MTTSNLNKIRELLTNFVQKLKKYNVIQLNDTILPTALFMASGNSRLESIALNDVGKRAFAQFLDRIRSMQHHPSGHFIERIHRINFIDDIVIELLQSQTPDFTAAAQKLAAETAYEYDLAIGISNIRVAGPISLQLAELHPPGLAQLTWVPSELRSLKYQEILYGHHWVVLEVTAETEGIAYLKALELARVSLSFLGDIPSSSVLSESVRIDRVYLVRNRTSGSVNCSFTQSHRWINLDPTNKQSAVDISEYQRRIGALAHIRASAPDLFKQLSKSAALLQRSKETNDPATKLTLITAATESLLMERYFKNGNTRVFNSRLQAAAGSNYQKVKCLTTIYGSRSAFLHSGTYKELRLSAYNYLEFFVQELIMRLASAGQSTHFDALVAANINLLIDDNVPIGSKSN